MNIYREPNIQDFLPEGYFTIQPSDILRRAIVLADVLDAYKAAEEELGSDEVKESHDWNITMEATMDLCTRGTQYSFTVPAQES